LAPNSPEITKVGDFSEKKGVYIYMGISSDPLGWGTYNLQLISTTPKRRIFEDKTSLKPLLMHRSIFLPVLKIV